MILHARPKGRGNWAIITLTIEGIEFDLLAFQKGYTFTLGGRTYRIVAVFDDGLTQAASSPRVDANRRPLGSSRTERRPAAAALPAL